MPDQRASHKEIPLNGKWYTTDPAAIGTNFQALTNMRYTDTHIRGVQGMTKINVTAATTYPRVRNAFHFKKAQIWATATAESHLLLQAYVTAETSSVVEDHVSVIPSTASFTNVTAFSDTSGAGRGFFSEAPDGQIIYANSIDNCIWGGNETRVGALITTATALTTAGSSVTSPSNYTDIINNTKVDSANVFTVGGTKNKTILVGSPRPARGVKISFTATINATANTLVAKHSSATVWTTCVTVIDGTRNVGDTASYTKSGSILWDTTVAVAKPKYIEGYYLYWYQLEIDDGSAEISHIALDCPFQGIVDMWDGVFRDVTRFFEYKTSIIDYTLNVLHDDYYASDSSTYYLANLPAFSTPNNCLYAGFEERMTGLKMDIAISNAEPACTMSVDYWNGTAYTSCGTITDGTSEGAISLAKTGVVTWNVSAITDETKKTETNSPSLYIYRIKFSTGVTGTTRINYIGGVTAQKSIGYYKFPIFAQGRVLLCADMSYEKNKALVSSKYMPQVYNGSDSVDLYFGEEGELTAGCELFSQFGSSLYSLILMFKDTETWVVAGQDITQWENNTFLLSSSIGCPAPLTLKTINLSQEPGVGTNRALAIWQGADGVYMSDGRAPIPIHGDIREYFDRQDARCIKASKVGDSVAFIDPVRQEYHLLLASGTAATTLNKELVYDIHRNKWFEIDRTADLQCGATVHDTDGNSFCYGFLDTGYIERLENGTDFDGTDIIHTFQTGDIPLGGLAVETRVSRLRLITVSKETTTSEITCTHYGDNSDTGTDKTMAPDRVGYRLAMPIFNDKLNGDPYHSFKFTITTDNETCGFEPLAIVATFHQVHAD